LNPLSAASFARANSGPGNGNATATGSGGATWVDASMGSVNFTLGWVIDGDAADRAVVTHGSGWSYNFIADASGDLKLSWEINASGQQGFGAVGLPMFGFNVIDRTAGMFLPSAFPGSTIGTSMVALTNEIDMITRSVVAGQTYSISIFPGSLMGTEQDLNATATATFNWRLPTGIIEAPVSGGVPEPITATLGLMGLGALGMATRRRMA